LLRHGQTAFSRDHVFCGAGLDPELTDAGAEMARQFAAAYRSVSWAAIYCSPMRRTVATAKPLCDAVGMRMELRDGLKEIAYGAWEGKSAGEIERDYGAEYARWLADPARNAPTGGESGEAVARRAMSVLEEIIERRTSGEILVVSHKATIRVVLCSLLGIELARFRDRIACPVGSVSVVEFTVNGPRLETLADRSHLSEQLRALPGS
jgi:probable phosphoglycerate mutase